MTTDFTVFSRQFMKSSPHDEDIKIMTAHVRNVVSDEVNILMPIPWENVRLVKTVACITEAEPNIGAWELDFELNITGGTEMMTITVAQNSAVGEVLEGTVTTESACQNLSSALAARDAINIESVGANTTPGGAANIYFIFEPELDVV